MKKIILASILFSALAFVFTGCLKDKGFENHQYGINDPDTQTQGVGFNFGKNAKVDFGLDVTASNQQVIDIVFVNLFGGKPAATDVQVTIIDNSVALINAYNALNGTSVQPLPASIWNVPFTLTVPAGAYNVSVPLNVTNTLALNPNIQYAIGLTITAVTGGYQVAENFKNLFILFSVKNQYDGKYNIKGQFYHPAYPFYPFATNVEMHTTGANSVKMWWPLAGDYGNPFATSPTGGGLAYFDLQDPDFTVNPATNAVTVQNVSAGAVTFYSMGLGYNNAGYNSRWDPPSKTFFVNYGYNLGAGGLFILGTSRMWIDTIIRTGPR